MFVIPAKNLLPSSDYCSENQVKSDMEATLNIQPQIPRAQLKLVFREILFKPPRFNIEYCSRCFSSNSRSRSTSATDSTSNTIYYEDYLSLYAVLSREDVEGLRCIARILNASEYLHDCAQLYIERRKDVVNMMFRLLRKKLDDKKGQVLEGWKELKETIQLWIQVAKICIGDIFVKEKSFYDQVFGGLAMVKDADDFVHIIANASVKIFESLASLMACRQFPWRLEILLPLHQELLDQMPTLDLLLQNSNFSLAKAIRWCATKTLAEIAERMMPTLAASERQVLRELSGITAGGKIHAMTEYVIGYIDLISNHKNSLIFAISQVSDNITAPTVDSTENEPVKHHATKMIEFLVCNLRHKSNFYKQESLGHLFMMNNIHRVAQAIKSSQGMQEILDHDFLGKLTEETEQAMSDYLKTSWDKVCSCLRTERSKSLTLLSFLSMNSSRVIKEKLKTFNRMLENVHQNQVEWVVNDRHVQNKLHQSILDRLIPAYSAFLEQFSSQIEKIHNQKRYIKYSVVDLEIKISNLFTLDCLVF